jgi:squalene-hopene/tetraprenyl-beta-curcumene cyclase
MMADLALAAAVRFLLDRQSPDGAWRSDTYGAFKEGDALTPLVLHTLQAAPTDPAVMAAVRHATAFLAALARSGIIDAGPFGLSYPVYTAALTVLALCRAGDAAQETALGAWLAYLRERQLTEALGWQAADPEYGGWGYAAGLPRKPAPGQPAPPYTESNLSATVLAVEALRAAGCPRDAPALAQALGFVCRCQNHAADHAGHDPAFDDGGFYFIPGDPQRNKAGPAGVDGAGRPRFASYGSMTADGLRALLACGLTDADARVRAARHWLEEHFTVAHHPGRFPAARQAIRASVYYYYCWSLAQALTASGADTVATPAGPVRWDAALAEELQRRQHPDGSWSNDAVEVREDDPILATALAAGALSLPRGS